MEIGRNALEAMLREKNCCLCGSAGDVLGLWMPDTQLLGQPKGKVVYCAYALCNECYVKPDKTQLVEAKINPVLKSHTN